jgi:hypothetical protein
MEEAKEQNFITNLNSKSKSNTINYSENIQKSDIDNYLLQNHFETELHFNNKISSNSLVQKQRQVFIIKNNDTNYLVNKESSVAPICSSNYSSRRLTEGLEQFRNSSKSQKKTTYNSNKESLIDQKLNSNFGSSLINNHFSKNFHLQERNYKVKSNEIDEICIVGSGNLNNPSNNLDVLKKNNMNENYNNHENYDMNYGPINENISLNNNDNPFKRLKVKESPKKIRTDPMNYEENSFNSNISGIRDKIISQNKKDIKKNINVAMKTNYKKINNDFNENSIDISNKVVINKNKSSNSSSINDNSSFKKSQTGHIFKYDDFFNKMKKKIEYKKDYSTNVSQKTSFNEITNIKKSSDKILEKLNNNIEQSKISKLLIKVIFSQFRY